MRDSDESLLKSFALDRDEKAFRALAERYLGLIFQTALRRTGNRPLAEEISQNILCALAKKSSALAKNPDLLPAWLHRATLFESTSAMRSEISHQRCKQLLTSDSSDESSSPWTEAIPHLDQALDKLPESDRSLLLLHYFENHPLPKIAQALGKKPAAVQKQSQRALDKLARILRSKGVTLSASVLATGLTSELAKAAPAAFLQSATAAVLTGSATYSTTGLTLMTLSKSKLLIPLAVLICAVPLAIQQVAISRAISHNNRLNSYLAANGSPAKNSPSSRGSRTLVTSTPSGRISIAALSRTLDDARSSTLNYDNFLITIESLTPDELAELIPGRHSHDARNEPFKHLFQ